jgi:hypothetical protein
MDAVAIASNAVVRRRNRTLVGLREGEFNKLTIDEPHHWDRRVGWSLACTLGAELGPRVLLALERENPEWKI